MFHLLQSCLLPSLDPEDLTLYFLLQYQPSAPFPLCGYTKLKLHSIHTVQHSRLALSLIFLDSRYPLFAFHLLKSKRPYRVQCHFRTLQCSLFHPCKPFYRVYYKLHHQSDQLTECLHEISSNHTLLACYSKTLLCTYLHYKS